MLTRFMPPTVRASVEARTSCVGAALPGLYCAGAEYPGIVRGEQHFALFWRTLPWDHAPGALFLAEAGGRVARPDGAPYRPADGRAGLLAAQKEAAWEDARGALLAAAKAGYGKRGRPQNKSGK